MYACRQLRVALVFGRALNRGRGGYPTLSTLQAPSTAGPATSSKAPTGQGDRFEARSERRFEPRAERPGRTGSLSPRFSSPNSSFDQVVFSLEGRLKRIGRIGHRDLLRCLKELRPGIPVRPDQALLLIRSCGSVMAEEPPAERQRHSEAVWHLLQERGVSLGIAHHNARLGVDIDNNLTPDWEQFVKRLEESKLNPDRDTYRRLLHAACRRGDVGTAATILERMKSLNMPVNETIFNSLVYGYSKIGDSANADALLQVMK